MLKIVWCILMCIWAIGAIAYFWLPTELNLFQKIGYSAGAVAVMIMAIDWIRS